jgi:hypothetical protein
VFISAHRGGLHFRMTQQPCPACSTPSPSPQVTRELCNTCYMAHQVRWKRPHLPLSILSVHLHNIAFVPFGILMALSTDNTAFHWHFESWTVSQKISLNVQFRCWKTAKSLFYREMSECIVLRHQSHLYSSTETCCWLFRWRESPLFWVSMKGLSRVQLLPHGMVTVWSECVERKHVGDIPSLPVPCVLPPTLLWLVIKCVAGQVTGQHSFVMCQFSVALIWDLIFVIFLLMSLRTLVGTWHRKLL